MRDNYEKQDGVECSGAVRDKYTKPSNEKEKWHFQLYTTYSKPGLVSIFHNADQRSFHNWSFEVGSGRKRGRIREAIDHQISSTVLEIAGDHNGSVYMMCPPSPNSVISVDMPFVTMLMKDMCGYSSVEFTVLDTLGFSRKICAKNFKSQCTIGELNCEIPMRLSPTWNYACINLDETLRNAFGTRLISVQGIKINANVRVRRIYFHEEIFPYKSLPQEFRIKLMLTVQEKQEILMYEEYLSNEPTTMPEKSFPWSMPKLVYTKPSLINYAIRMSEKARIEALTKKQEPKVEILEVPQVEDADDKYTSSGAIQSTTNTGLLRDMLQKAIPHFKILLPTLSLIYPDRRDQGNADVADIVDGFLKKKKKAKSNSAQKQVRTCEGVDEKMENFRKMKRCIEPSSPRIEVQDEQSFHLNVGIEEQQQQQQTDWEKIHGHRHSMSGHESKRNSRDASPERPESDSVSSPSGGSPRSEQHHHHHHVRGCGKFTVAELAQYLKHREVFGDYDMFTSSVGNPRFLTVPDGETVEGESSTEEETEEETSTTDSAEALIMEKIFTTHDEGSTSLPVPRKSSNGQTRVDANRIRISHLSLHEPSKSGDGLFTEYGIHSTESLPSKRVGSRIMELNQQLLTDPRTDFAGEVEAKARNKSVLEARASMLQQQQPLLGTSRTPTRNQRAPQQVSERTEVLRRAGLKLPMVPK